DDPAGRFEACGWHTTACDGHDPEDIARAIDAALADPRPSLVSCRTTIALGAPTKAGTAASHGAPLGADEVAAAREALGWSHAPFILPEDIAAAWREAGAKGRAAREAWHARLEASPDRAEFERRMSGALPAGFEAAMAEYKAGLLADPPKLATRQASQRALGAVNAALPETIGGSADLTGSNGTLTPGLEPYSAENYGGRYLHYGVREHGMAAAMNGMALHGGVIPYGATFLTFTDYCRPSIRLAALMGVRSIFVMTHDSIGLGEDGPTHQPIEHLASLRAMPGLLTMRPADAVETAECWEIALALEGPSVIALTRQGVSAVRTEAAAENLSARGAYVLADCEGEPAAVLVATGSEVGLAMEAKAVLDGSGAPVRVVSMPCMELFERQDADYRASVLPAGPVRVAVEAAASFGWERHVGPGGAVVGIDSFGASAPAPALYEHFGITAARVVEEVRARLG
ncbi:MAG: transketolase, partial [Chloroflexi bacterium]|nr:transketolase [Chloroflexota bacterium]